MLLQFLVALSELEQFYVNIELRKEVNFFFSHINIYQERALYSATNKVCEKVYRSHIII